MKRLIMQALLAAVISAPQIFVAQAEPLPGTVRFVEHGDAMASWVYAYVRAEAGPILEIADESISFDRDPALMFVCMGGEVAVVYRFDTELIGEDNAVRVQFRLDEQRSTKRQMWSLIQDPNAAAEAQVATAVLGADPANPILQMFPSMGTAAKMPTESATDFLRTARAADRVTVRVTDPADGETHIDVFPLNGFSAAIDRVTSAC